ncbi:MAG: DNA polymerase III subunit beta [Phycisphaerales bacterium]|jgi:DNA polymerase-3 subunit beta|nr:DNA polymerase III subunit beta [Phycisphaerales bacterium]
MTVKQATNIKANCEREALVDAMALITGVVAGRTPTPALQCVRVIGDDGRLTLAATDTEVSLTLSIDRVELEQDGEVLVPADKLSQIARSCDDNTLDIVGDDDAMVVRSSDSRFKVFGFPISEAPDIACFEDTEPDFTIECDVFRTLMERTTFAAATDHSRYAINGVHLDLDGSQVRLVATNGHRLALATGACNNNTDKKDCIIPTKAMTLLKRLLSDGDGSVAVKVESGRVVFHVDNGSGCTSTLTSNLVEGTFPPFEDVIPKDLDRKVVINRGALHRAVRRAHLMTNEESRGVRLIFNDATLKIKSQAPETGEAEIEVPIESFTGETLEIAFNPVYIMDALKVITADEVTIELKKSEKPGLVRSGNNFIYIIMPVNL